MMRVRRLSASLGALVMTLAALGIGTATGAAAQATSWAAAGDFSAASNPNGAWSYGWSASRGSAFNLDTVATTVSGVNVWNYSATQVEPDVFFNGTSNTINPSGTNPIPAGSLAFHPGPLGQNAVVRWTAPTTGAYAIGATFTGRDFVGPTTTDVAVLSNGGLLWSAEVTGYLAMQSYAASRLDLIAGDTLDFTVGFGTDRQPDRHNVHRFEDLHRRRNGSRQQPGERVGPIFGWLRHLLAVRPDQGGPQRGRGADKARPLRFKQRQSILVDHHGDRRGCDVGGDGRSCNAGFRG